MERLSRNRSVGQTFQNREKQKEIPRRRYAACLVQKYAGTIFFRKVYRNARRYKNREERLDSFFKRGRLPRAYRWEKSLYLANKKCPTTKRNTRKRF